MIQISVDTRRAVVTNKELLTVGSAGIQVEFTLSEDWDGLSKLAVFRVGDDGTKVDMVLDDSLTCTVPTEVLTEEDEVLFIGIYGSNGQGTVIIPTIWASAGVVKPGTIPNTPASATPTPEIWAQILSVANDAEQTATDAMSIVEDVVNHTPIIQDGYWYFWNEDAQEYQSTGIKAEGEDGTSPTITVVDIEGGHRVTITDVDHPQGQTVDVMNGTDGDDGYSPAVTIAEITGGHRVTITDETHPQGQSFDVMDGASDAGDIEFDPTETYAAGSVGAELSNQKNAISQLGDIAAFKTAILQLAQKVAYIDEHGQDYYDDLYDALYPPVPLVSISAAFTQGSTVVYDTDTLDDLKPMLTVTATYEDQTTAVVTNYTLSGTLTVGTSVITVSYRDKTTTFNVVVTEANIFDPETASKSGLFVSVNNMRYEVSPVTQYNSAFIAINPNTSYQISKDASGQFRVATSANQPGTNVSITNTEANHSGTSISITSGANDNWLFITYWANTTSEGYDPDVILNSIKVYPS